MTIDLVRGYKVWVCRLTDELYWHRGLTRGLKERRNDLDKEDIRRSNLIYYRDKKVTWSWGFGRLIETEYRKVVETKVIYRS